MSDEIAVVATIVAKPGREADTLDLLRGLIDPTRREDGCLQYDLHRDLGDERRFVFFERWTSREALDLHSRQPHLQRLGELTGELFEAPPHLVLLELDGQ